MQHAEIEIRPGAYDLAMVDIMKIGGITGWMSAMAQAEAAALPLSSHTFVEPCGSQFGGWKPTVLG
jgi:L-alanine-DL-glutamate epimerase-like enolase superfamily enzyme